MKKTIKEAQKEYLEEMLEYIKEFSDEEFMEFFNTMTIDKALKLGFRQCSSTSPLYLIPDCFVEFMPVGLKLMSMGGRYVIYDGNNIDLDTRGGLLAYGLILKE